MSKIVSAPKIGIPVPSTVDPSVVALDVYYGSKGFSPSYTQAARLSLDISKVPQQTVNGAGYYVFDTGQLASANLSGNYDFYFTLQDSAGNEGDFSPVVDVPLDFIAPVTLGQPIVL